jgi:ribosomal RNA-processing protein 9
MSKNLKRSKSQSKEKQQPSKQLNRSFKLDEEISSESEAEKAGDDSGSDEFSEDENAEAKRKRLAKEYLSKFKGENGGGSDSDDEDVAGALQKDRLASHGKLMRTLSPAMESLGSDGYTQRTYSGHSSSLTCLALSKDEKTVFSGSKDNSIIRWDLESGQKTVAQAKSPDTVAAS